ncbi:MAG: AhpC/TSA family protein [Bacteroidaceae bacterium]|nr:AhpC/TSA family protein [Bacteroidaceae bacterium]
MKRLFFALAAAVLLGACDSSTKYTITGNAADFEDGRSVYLVTAVNDEIAILDSTVVKNHSFTIKGEVNEPCWARVGIQESLKASDGIIIEFILEPGHIVFGDFDEAKSRRRTATGTPLNDKLTQFFCEMKTILDDTSLTRTESMNQVYALVRSYVIENADNEAALFLFERFDRSMPKDMKLELIDTLAAANPTLYADLRKETLEDIEAQKRAEEQAQSVAPGNPYKNVEGNDASGKKLSLKEVVENKKNKFVLLDFWATWCGPCMNEIPHLKAAYDKFHNKGFEIYAISLDDESDAWTKVINEKGLQWVNVLREGKEATELYGVRGIPSNYLIDCSTGIIVATHLRGQALIEKLEEAIK